MTKLITQSLLALVCVGMTSRAATATKHKTAAKSAPTPAPIVDPNKGKTVIAVFETSMGTFSAKLYADKAPKTVANFTGLAEGTHEWTDPKTNKKVKRPLYDGTVFHRIIAGFMIQGGDPLGNGTGGPGYKFDNEISPDLKHSKPGILAMANAGPNTNGSQFYITVDKKEYLDGSYSVFGEVTGEGSKPDGTKIEGIKIIDEISRVKTGAMDRPVEPVTLKSVKIQRT